MTKDYAFIKNGIVFNIAVFDDPSEEILETFKVQHGADIVIEANENTEINGTYDGTKFWRIQPYSSWIKNEELNEWEAPIAKPEFDPENAKYYTWDEETLSWIEQ